MSTSPLRLVRSAPDPLGLYIRAGRVDQKDLQSFITSGSLAFTGVVFEAKRVGQQQELLTLVLERGLDAVLDQRFFESGGGRARSAFGCRDTNCCHRGVDDMLRAPARHFLYQRTQQVAGLGQIPESIRPTEFLEEHLRPASDAALVAIKLALPDDLKQKADKQAKRLNDLRTTLGPYAKKRRDSSFARHPVTRIARGGIR